MNCGSVSSHCCSKLCTPLRGERQATIVCVIGEGVKSRIVVRKRIMLKRSMRNMEMGLVGDYIAGIGLDAAKQHMESKMDEHKLKCALKKYIESERKYKDICTMAEECDFQGLVEYITQELLDDVEKKIFCCECKR